MEKKTKIKVIIILLIIIFPLIGVAVFLSGLQEPDVEVKNIEFQSFDLEVPSITFLVTVDVYNPNGISATLNYVRVNVFIDNEFTGLVNQKVNQEIKAKEHTTLELDFVMYDVPVIDSRVVEVSVKGHAKLTVTILSFSIPIDKTEEVEITGGETNRLPNAVIIHDAGVVERTGSTINFDGSLSTDPDGTIMIYEWNFDDGSPVEYGVNVNHAFQSRGQYTVTLTVYDNWNASASDNAVITVMGF